MLFLKKYGYMIIFVLLIIVAFVQNARKNKQRNLEIIWLLIGYVFFYSVRNTSVGFDYKEYLRVYNAAGQLPLDDYLRAYGYMEKGYLLYNWCMASVRASVPIFQLGLVIMFVTLLYKYLIVKSENSIFTIFALYGLGIFFNYMNQARSALAAAICLAAVDLAQRKKWLQSFLILAAACMVHTSAVVGIALVVWIGFGVKISRKNLISLFGLTATAWITFDKTLMLMLKIFPRYQGYFAKDKIEIFIKRGSINYLIVFGAIFALSLYCRRYIKRQNLGSYDVLLWGNILGVVISVLCIKISMMQRFMTLPLILSAALLSEAVHSIPRAKLRMSVYCMTSMALIGYCYIYLYIAESGMGRDGVVPYAFM